MSNTPLTDGTMKYCFNTDEEYVKVSFARKLEVKLATAEQALEDCREAVIDCTWETISITYDGEKEVRKEKQCLVCKGIHAHKLDCKLHAALSSTPPTGWVREEKLAIAIEALEHIQEKAEGYVDDSPDRPAIASLSNMIYTVATDALTQLPTIATAAQKEQT